MSSTLSRHDLSDPDSRASLEYTFPCLDSLTKLLLVWCLTLWFMLSLHHSREVSSLTL